MSRKHVVITGTGRAGTSFLVELLTHLGLETGYQVEDIGQHKSKTARAGLEHDIRDAAAPYVVKSPWFCEHATEVLERDDIKIEHVFIPMRDVQAAAESRRFVTSQSVSAMPMLKRLRFYLSPKVVPGGIWRTDAWTSQEAALLDQLYKLTLSLSNTTVPVTLLRYPLLVNDSLYLYAKLQPLLSGIRFEEFDAIFDRVANPNLVHCFSANDR